MIDSLARDARALWRAESIIADIKARHLVARSGLTAGAGLIAIFGLGMFNAATFFALQTGWGASWAAAAVGCADFLIAGALFFLAGRTKPGRELDMAIELRQSALDSLELDARSIQADLTRLGEEVKAARLAALGIIKHPLDSALPALLIPIATALLKSLRKADAPAAN